MHKTFFLLPLLLLFGCIDHYNVGVQYLNDWSKSQEIVIGNEFNYDEINEIKEGIFVWERTFNGFRDYHITHGDGDTTDSNAIIIHRGDSHNAHVRGYTAGNFIYLNEVNPFVVIHEMAHAYGVGEISGTIMDANYSNGCINKKVAEAVCSKQGCIADYLRYCL